MNKFYSFILNGHKYDSPKEIIKGKEILEIAELEPVESYELLLRVSKNEFEPIQLDEEVDLSKPGKERFDARPYKKIEVSVDDEPVFFEECFTTPTKILIKAGYDPKGFYLKQIIRNKEISYKNDPDHRIALRNKMVFSTCKIGPVTVS